MKVIRTLKELKENLKPLPSGVAIGTFDGLHIGHQQVIKALVDTCAKQDLRSVVYTFANHPREFTAKESLPNRILTVDEKIDLLDGMRIDFTSEGPMQGGWVHLRASNTEPVFRIISEGISEKQAAQIQSHFTKLVGSV